MNGKEITMQVPKFDSLEVITQKLRYRGFIYCHNVDALLSR